MFHKHSQWTWTRSQLQPQGSDWFIVRLGTSAVPCNGERKIWYLALRAGKTTKRVLLAAQKGMIRHTPTASNNCLWKSPCIYQLVVYLFLQDSEIYLLHQYFWKEKSEENWFFLMHLWKQLASKMSATTPATSFFLKI